MSQWNVPCFAWLGAMGRSDGATRPLPLYLFYLSQRVDEVLPVGGAEAGHVVVALQRDLSTSPATSGVASLVPPPGVSQSAGFLPGAVLNSPTAIAVAGSASADR